MTKKRYYKYMITLNAPMWPRKIADELSFARGVDAHLVSVTDLQNAGHIYGDTYRVRAVAGQDLMPRRDGGAR